MTHTKQEVLEMCRSEKVQFVDLQFTDLLGMLKAISIPVSKLDGVLENNAWFDGSSIEGFMRIFESDMFLKPDLSTFAILPWTRGTENVTARLICDVYLPDGARFKGDPRYILQRQVERINKMGYEFFVGPELEFFLFEPNGKGVVHALPHDEGGYFDQTMDLAAEVRREMTRDLQYMHIDVEALHHEVAEGQHEIDFRYDKAVKTADNSITFKHVLKAVASRHGLLATFMPKPICGKSGSGMHVHQSLFKDGKNMFYDASDAHNLSKLAKQFIAGQMHHIKAINAVTNPIVNSYKRLVVGYEAPVCVAWATRNRSVLIRIPRINPGMESAVRCELRCPDPAANPYLAFAVMLAAGIDGIEKEMEVPEAIEEDLYEMTEKELAERGIGSVASDLNEAIDALRDDKVIRDALGEHSFEIYYKAKKAEWNEYRLQVGDWERERYMELY